MPPLLWTLTIDCTKKNAMAEWWTEERVDGAIHSRALWSTCKRGAAQDEKKKKKKEERNNNRRSAASDGDDDGGKVSSSSSFLSQLGGELVAAAGLALLKTRSERTHALPYICSLVVSSEVSTSVCVEIKSSGRTHLQKVWVGSHV